MLEEGAFLNIPNILTIFRLLLVPVFIYLMNAEMYLMSFIVFSTASITDIADGYIAKKFNMITNFGKLMDPLADKVMQTSAILMLTIKGFLNWPVLAVLLAKDLFMVFAAAILYKRRIVVQSNRYGKAATVFLYIGVAMSIFKLPGYQVVISLAVLSTIFALVMYILAYRKSVIKKKSQ